MGCRYCDKNNHNTADWSEIEEAKQHKKAQHGTKAVPEKQALSFFLRRSTPLKAVKPCKGRESQKEEG
jgi:hypothetical protein